MRLRCPKCDTVFPAKASSRNIKCPECGTREQAPSEGWRESAGWRKGKLGAFTRVGEPASGASPSRDPRLVWGAVAVVAILLVAGWWYFGQDRGTGGALGSSCGVPIANLTRTDPADTLVEFQTESGCFTLETYDAKSPITVENFLTYAREGFYDGLVFHRVVNSGIFVIQGGGQRADGSQPQTHPAIVNEAKVSGLKNEAYTISMARMGKNPDGTGDGADTATSQFFINTKANPALDPGGSSPAGYAVFGLVIQGRDVVDAIQNAPADPSNPEKPVHAVAMQKVRIVGATAVSLSSSSTTSEPAPTCTSMPNGAPPPAGTAEVDLVTPGVWNVCSETDSNYVWVHNNGTSALDYTWSLTGAGGAALPEGWAATFATPAGTIAQAGATESAWAATVVTLHVPATQPAGEVPAELHAGGATRAFVFHVALPLGRVAVAGDNVMTHYDLWDSKGNAIQLDGDFCATLGPKTNAVSGYGYGLIGVAKGETVTLVVPPPFAYHYSGHSLSGKTLVWRATITDYGCAA